MAGKSSRIGFFLFQRDRQRKALHLKMPNPVFAAIGAPMIVSAALRAKGQSPSFARFPSEESAGPVQLSARWICMFPNSAACYFRDRRGYPPMCRWADRELVTGKASFLRGARRFLFRKATYPGLYKRGYFFLCLKDRSARSFLPR